MKTDKDPLKQDIERIIKHICENHDKKVNIDELAQLINMSKFYFIRVFKTYVGVTPIQFLHLITINYARASLRNSKNLLDTSFSMGLSSSSKLHNMFVNVYGVTPLEFKTYANNIQISYVLQDSTLGKALLAHTSRGICYFRFINKDAQIDEFKEFWKNANLSYDESLKTKFKHMFDPNDYKILKSVNEQMNLYIALIYLATNLDEKDRLYDKKIKFLQSAVPCYKCIIQTNIFSDYRWGIIPKKHRVVYEPIKFSKD